MSTTLKQRIEAALTEASASPGVSVAIPGRVETVHYTVAHGMRRVAIYRLDSPTLGYEVAAEISKVQAVRVFAWALRASDEAPDAYAAEAERRAAESGESHIVTKAIRGDSPANVATYRVGRLPWPGEEVVYTAGSAPK